MTEPQTSPLKRVLDAGLYAPLGLLLNRNEVVAELASAGRKQLSFSRSLGRAALKTVSRGLSPTERAAADASKGKSPSQPASAATSAKNAPVVPTSKPIAGFASLSAREIIAASASYSVEEVAWAVQAEKSGKNRVTVLRALQGREQAT